MERAAQLPRRAGHKAWRPLRLAAAASILLGLAACGRPQAPDLRGEMTEAVSRLGVRPIYPLSESHRIGAVYLIDASQARPRSGLPAWQEPSILLTEELVSKFEQARVARASLTARFTQSATGLGAALRPGTTGQAFYRQTPAAAGDAVAANSLALAAMPGFTLASVDQASIGGFVPAAIASVFASLGLRHTSYLRLEAEGVEMAELPHDEFRFLISSACQGSGRETQFGGTGEGGIGVVQSAYNILEQQRTEPGAGSRGGGVEPHLALLRRVFYLRGVRFVVDDSRVAAAFVQVALRSNLAPGASAVPLPALRANPELAPAQPPGGPPPAAGTPQASAAANAAAINALQAQFEQMRGVLAAGSGPQLGGSFARAAATGIELVQLFDRPLAFGYQAFFVDARRDRRVPASSDNLEGLAPLCRSA